MILKDGSFQIMILNGGEKDIFLEPGTEMFWAGTWEAPWESVRLTFDWWRKDDAVVVVSGKAVPIVPLCQVSSHAAPRDVVGLQCVYSQHPPSHSLHIGAIPPWDGWFRPQLKAAAEYCHPKFCLGGGRGGIR